MFDVHRHTDNFEEHEQQLRCEYGRKIGADFCNIVSADRDIFDGKQAKPKFVMILK
jgi:hypothetical protein